MRMPPGFKQENTILKLQKALYGLRESPLLWQKDLTATLKELGCDEVKHEPCCWIKDGVIIFFYVDDIVMAYKKEKEAVAMELTAGIKKKYALQGGEDLQWFLGVAVIRDRANKTLWLSQAEYINKMDRFVRNGRKIRKTPMTAVELTPFEGEATYAEITNYQRMIGSILYAAVITRPDVAFAISRLARFNLNPGPQHQAAAIHAIEYLLDTATFALKIGGEDTFNTWSDASFADNTIDRRSSQGYAMKLFGGLIGWRANKQDTVTTSTTEAELPALSQAAKEAQFSWRLIQEIGVPLEKKIQLWCDNTQTIRLVTRDIATLQTKLRHVDIHNHWLREKISNGEISVDYVNTKEQVADGFTKALADQDFQRFRTQVGVVDILELLNQRAINPISEEDLEELEDLMDGGEAIVSTIQP